MDHMARDIHTMTLDDWMLFRKVSSIVDNKLGTLVLHEEHLTRVRLDALLLSTRRVK